MKEQSKKTIFLSKVEQLIFDSGVQQSKYVSEKENEILKAKVKTLQEALGKLNIILADECRFYYDQGKKHNSKAQFELGIKSGIAHAVLLKEVEDG